MRVFPEQQRHRKGNEALGKKGYGRGKEQGSRWLLAAATGSVECGDEEGGLDVGADVLRRLMRDNPEVEERIPEEG